MTMRCEQCGNVGLVGRKTDTHLYRVNEKVITISIHFHGEKIRQKKVPHSHISHTCQESVGIPTFFRV